MLRFRQLDLFLGACKAAVVGSVSFPRSAATEQEKLTVSRGPIRDPLLETEAQELLTALGLGALAHRVQIEWNPRLRTAAGRADFRRALVSLNPRLRAHAPAEVDRTLRHELAHLVAHARAGRRRIAPHGPEWREACGDLGIAKEERCHTLPFPAQRRARRFLYRCARCQTDFPRVRRMRRTVACLACCRRHNRGKFSSEFQLRLVPANART